MQFPSIAVISRCGRYRITVAPCDAGSMLLLWHLPVGAGMWRLQGRRELALPHHAALDVAYDLIVQHCNNTPAADLRRGLGTGEWYE